MTVTDIGVIVALVAMLAMHFFRSPNRQADDLRDELTRLRGEVMDGRRNHDALSARVSGEHTALVRQLSSEHYTRSEIREMLQEIKEQVGLIQGVVSELKTGIAILMGNKNGGRSGH